MTAQNPKATLYALTMGEALTPDAIKEQSICIDKDISDVLNDLG